MIRLIAADPGWMLPANGSSAAASLDRHLVFNLWIAVALLAFAHLVLFAGLLLRRRVPRPRSGFLLEVLPITALAMLFALLAVRAESLWAASRYIGPDPAALQVEVTGVQFAWYFRYPGPDAAFGRTRPDLVEPAAGNPLGLDPADPRGADDFVSSALVLPAGREVDLHLRAQDVIHGFAIPSMRLKQNAIPGEILHLHFTPTVPGTYAILCTQLCGLGHYRMSADLRVLPPDAYFSWLAEKQSAAPQ